MYMDLTGADSSKPWNNQMVPAVGTTTSVKFASVGHTSRYNYQDANSNIGLTLWAPLIQLHHVATGSMFKIIILDIVVVISVFTGQ